jgi:hypothetical protein
MKAIIGCATYPGESCIGGCQGLHQRCAGRRYCGHFAPTLEKFSALVCLMALQSAWAAVALPMPFSPRPATTFAACSRG